MEIFWSIQNGGDGSAHPWFFTTKELAIWDQNHMDESWGEPCWGSLTVNVKGDEAFHHRVDCDDAMDAVSYWLMRTEEEDEDERWELRDEFLAAFFPDGLPTFRVNARPGSSYYDIWVNGEIKGRRFAWSGSKQAVVTESGRAALAKRLNA